MLRPKLALLAICWSFLRSIAAASVPEVMVGVYITQISQISVKTSDFVADFWIWFLWSDSIPNYDPLVSTEIPASEGAFGLSFPAATFLNTTGQNYYQAKIRATVIRGIEVQRYPFDDHTLVIDFEDAFRPSHQLKFVADPKSRMRPNIASAVWNFGDISVDVVDARYTTTFGDPLVSVEDKYSRFRVEIPISRTHRITMFLKTMCSALAGIILITSALMIPAKSLNDRLFLGTAAVFCVIGNQIILDNLLPPSPKLPLLYQIQVFAFLWILVLNLVMLMAHKDTSILVSILGMFKKPSRRRSEVKPST